MLNGPNGPVAIPTHQLPHVKERDNPHPRGYSVWLLPVGKAHMPHPERVRVGPVCPSFAEAMTHITQSERAGSWCICRGPEYDPAAVAYQCTQ